MSKVDLHLFGNQEALFEETAGAIVEKLVAAVRTRGHASLVVSGGKTPGPLFDRLSRRDAPWDRTTITLSDERWVPADSNDSNEKLARARLIVGKASAANFIGLKTPAPDPFAAEGTVHARLAAMARPFDLILLGMGPDGHTASLIPGSQGLAGALDLGDPALARAIVPPPATAMGPRMTMTLRALLDARAIVLVIAGDDKRDVYERACVGKDAMEMPIRAVLHQNTVPVTVCWAA